MSSVVFFIETSQSQRSQRISNTDVATYTLACLGKNLPALCEQVGEARDQRPHFSGCDTGELPHIPHEMRVVVVAELQRQVRPSSGTATTQVIHQTIESDNPCEELRGNTDVISEDRDEMLLTVAQLATERA